MTEEGFLPLFHFNGVNFILTLVVFFSLLALLGRYVWKPILKVLEDRDEKIRRDLDAAEKKRVEAELALEERRKLEQKLREDSAEILRNARTAAEKEAQSIMTAARADAQRVVEQTRLDILRERDAAIKEIRRMAVNVGVDLAKKLMKKELDASRHEAVISDSMADLDKAWRGR